MTGVLALGYDTGRQEQARVCQGHDWIDGGSLLILLMTACVQVFLYSTSYQREAMFSAFLLRAT